MSAQVCPLSVLFHRPWFSCVEAYTVVGTLGSSATLKMPVTPGGVTFVQIPSLRGTAVFSATETSGESDGGGGSFFLPPVPPLPVAPAVPLPPEPTEPPSSSGVSPAFPSLSSGVADFDAVPVQACKPATRAMTPQAPDPISAQ